jgi:hypothetical protein
MTLEDCAASRSVWRAGNKIGTIGFVLRAEPLAEPLQALYQRKNRVLLAQEEFHSVIMDLKNLRRAGGKG